MLSVAVDYALIAGTYVGIPLVAMFSALLARTFYLRNRLQTSFDVAAAKKAGVQWVLSLDGSKRVVSYRVYGSDQQNARTLVFLHGAVTESGLDPSLPGRLKTLKALNVRAVAPDLPGVGFSDCAPVGQTLDDWAKHDLGAVLAQEGVTAGTRFVVESFSLGSSWAIATARHYGPERCVGLGLHCPILVSRAICQKQGLQRFADKNGKELPEHPLVELWRAPVGLGLWENALFPMIRDHPEWVFEPVKMNANKARNAAFMQAWHDSLDAAAARGRTGVLSFVDRGNVEQAGFDLEQWIATEGGKIPAVCVWYAEEDDLAVPEHGKWYADRFRSAAAAANGQTTSSSVHVRTVNNGLGHFSFFAPEAGPVSQTVTLVDTLGDQWR